MRITAGDQHEPVCLLCLFYGSIILRFSCRTAALVLVGVQFPAQGHFSGKDANVTKASTWTSSLKESLFPHYSPCSFIINAACQYMLYVQSFPLTWRCNDPICPQGTLKFHLMCSNGVIQTLLKDSVLRLKLYLSAVVADFNGRHFIRSSSRSMNNTSLLLKYLEAFKPHWHFHCNTLAIINRANFFTVINNGVEDSIIEPHIKLHSLNWLSCMHQLRLLSRTMEGQCDRYII